MDVIDVTSTEQRDCGFADYSSGRYRVLDGEDELCSHTYRFALHYSYENGDRTAGAPDTQDHVKVDQDTRERASLNRDRDWHGVIELDSQYNSERDTNSVGGNLTFKRDRFSVSGEARVDSRGNVTANGKARLEF